MRISDKKAFLGNLKRTLPQLRYWTQLHLNIDVVLKPIAALFEDKHHFFMTRFKDNKWIVTSITTRFNMCGNINYQQDQFTIAKKCPDKRNGFFSMESH